MNYRAQEIIRIIFPGLYVVVILCLICFYKHQSMFDDKIISNISGILVLSLPFIGFIVGYFIEILMSAIEHILYSVGVPRPSKDVLQGYILKGFNPYTLNNRTIIKSSLKVKTLNNKDCGEALQKAKQAIDRSKVQDFYYNSIFARNISGSQLIVTILLIFQTDWLWLKILFEIMTILSFIYWFHMNHVYVKYVFAEYGKTLEETK